MKAYPCIGGPLDGKFATSIDFHGQWVEKKDGSLSHFEEGRYYHLDSDYAEFHNAHRSKKRAQVCWIHISLLPVAISP